MHIIQEKYTFISSDIDKASEQFFKVCEELKMDRKESIKQRLAFENTLMTWASEFGESKEFVFHAYKRFGVPHVALRCVDNRSVNPFKVDVEDVYSNSILNILSNAPEYYFNAGINTVIIKLKKPTMNPMVQLAIIIACSLTVGFLGKFLLPASIVQTLLTYIIEPCYSTFLNILSCIAGPLIFLSVAWGIYGVGDVATFNKLGKSLMVFHVVSAFISSAFAMLSFPFFGLHLSTAGADASQIFRILDLILGMFPRTIIQPFADGNTLQIIVMAVIVGIALLYLGKRSRSIANAIEQFNNVVSFTLQIVGNLIPIFVALVLINLVWSDGFAIVATAWKFIAVLIPVLLVYAVLFCAVVSAKVKVNPLLIAKKILPAAFYGFTTASTAATFNEITTACKKLGVSQSMIGFGVPLGIVIQKSTVAAYYAIMTLYIASATGVEISISWMVIAVIVMAITACAAPPIPGAGSIAFSMIFSQLGISLSTIGIVLAIEVVVDFFVTAINVFCIPLSLAFVSSRYGLIDRETLESK